MGMGMAARGWVAPFMMTDEPPVGRENVVPEMVMGEAPAERVWEPMR